MMDGVELIRAERERQQLVEGFTSKHDDAHSGGVLAAASSAYTLMACDQLAEEPVSFEEASYRQLAKSWPWDVEWWKPSPEPVRNLVKAGALIAAEIDRLQRMKR